MITESDMSIGTQPGFLAKALSVIIGVALPFAVWEAGEAMESSSMHIAVQVVLSIVLLALALPMFVACWLYATGNITNIDRGEEDGKVG